MVTTVLSFRAFADWVRERLELDEDIELTTRSGLRDLGVVDSLAAYELVVEMEDLAGRALSADAIAELDELRTFGDLYLAYWRCCR